MNMHFSIWTIPTEQQTFISDIYQYWIILSGNLSIGYDYQSFHLISHDMLVVPRNTEISLTLSKPVTVGSIELTDFVTTNTKIQHLHNQDTELIRKVFFFAYDIQGMHRPHMPAIMSSIHQLMLEILLSRNTGRSASINPCVLQVLEDINAHFRDSSYDLAGAIASVGYSPSHFRRLFRDEVGMPPLEFLNNRRLDYAKKLMRQQKAGLTIKDIAIQSGYTDAYYFSRMFKKSENKTPSEYMKEIAVQPIN